jgi:hypothetical protein
MFLGHFGLAFAAKHAAPRTSLGMLLLGAQFADLIWPLLLIAGVEQVQIQQGATPFLDPVFSAYPYSHSLLTQCLLGVLLGSVYYALRHNGRGALLVGLLVPSHWLLDWLVHVPDLPLFPGDADKYGLGIWRSVPLTLACEFALFGAGLAIYLVTTRALDRTGNWALWSFVALLLLLYISTILSGPPPGASVLAWSALSLWLLPVWLHWADRHRVPRVRAH